MYLCNSLTQLIHYFTISIAKTINKANFKNLSKYKCHVICFCFHLSEKTGTTCDTENHTKMFLFLFYTEKNKNKNKNKTKQKKSHYENPFDKSH